MITIYPPRIEHQTERSFLKARIVDKAQKIDEEFFFSTQREFGEYLTARADAFLVAVLMAAQRTGQDITVEGELSERLYYNAKHTMTYIFAHIYGGRRICIKVKTLVNKKLEGSGNAVGCGCSLGVDSFANLLTHSSEDCPEGYKITHLTYFNVGAMGYVDLEKAKASYLKDLQMVKDFAATLHMPVVEMTPIFTSCSQASISTSRAT